MRNSMRMGLIVVFCLTVISCLPGCSPKALAVPAPAPPAVEVLIPVAQPCEVAKVPPSELETQKAPVPNDIYGAVQMILADRAILKGDRVRLADSRDHRAIVLTRVEG